MEATLTRVREEATVREKRLEELSAALREREQALDTEAAARAEAEAERDRLRADERAVGKRVPLPALAPATAAASQNGNGKLTGWHAQGQARLTWTLAEASTAYEGARGALAVLGETLGWAAAGCYTADDPSGGLRCCAFWQAPGSEADELETMSWHATFRPGPDLVGRVLERGETRWVEDLAAVNGFGRARAAIAGGLQSVVLVPIVSRDDTLGFLEVFAGRPMPLDEPLLEVLATVGLQLGQFFMRSEVESLRSRYGLIHR
jgi:hypothetical protein